jgi:rubrerythrin
MMLRRAGEIELGFEQEAQWEAYYEKEKLREVLMELIVDSARHADMVQALIGKVKANPVKTYPPLHGRLFSFRNKNELEMMMELGRTEQLMKDLYTDISNAVKASPPGLLNKEEDMAAFLADLEYLIDAETHHADLVTKYVGKVERIH